MIKIYIESGVAAAQKNNKRTTPEQDFIEKFIEHHFAGKKANVDFMVCGLGGKDTLEASAPLFRDITDEDSNIVIFDADTQHNNGGFSDRQKHIASERERLGLEFEFFLWPNNHDDGDFESMLLNMINPKHAGILKCYEGFEMCVGGHDPEQKQYDLPGRKGEVYTYVEIQKLTDDQRKQLSKGFYQFDNTEYWDMDAEYCSSLKTFLSTYFS